MLKINEVNYHKGFETDAEHLEMIQFRTRLSNLFPGFYKREKEIIQNTYLQTSEDLLIKLSCKVLKAVCKQTIDLYKDSLSDDDFYKMVESSYFYVLPLVIYNENKFLCKRYYYYEPIIASCFYLLHKSNEQVHKLLNSTKDMDKLSEISLLLIHNIKRSMLSSLSLFALGDDVHGFALIRGIVEQFSRLILLDDTNIHKFVEYINLNKDLQEYKMKKSRNNNTLIPYELKKFLEINNLSINSSEKVLLNGWCKNQANRPVQTNIELVRLAFIGTNMEKFVDLYHFSSEFIHEDYLFVNYDYISMRANSRYLFTFFILKIASILSHIKSDLYMDKDVLSYLESIKYSK